ncbi:MAG: hypothetical protein MHM6MM_002934 [Cercozoa sp. M6MM]
MGRGPKSSRQRLKTKYMIAKKAKEHKRKMNKALRIAKAADPESFKAARRRKQRQAAHIPNSFPGKAEMLAAIKKMQEEKLAEEEKRREARRHRREKLRKQRALEEEEAQREFREKRNGGEASADAEDQPTADAEPQVSTREW